LSDNKLVISTDSGDWIGPFDEHGEAVDFGSMFGEAFEWFIETYKPDEMGNQVDNPVKFANIYKEGYEEGLDLKSPRDYLNLPQDHPVLLIEDWISKNCTKYGGKFQNEGTTNQKCVFII
jgi:hypothetical protein